MKKLIILIFVLSMLLCLFSCEKSKKIGDNGSQGENIPSDDVIADQDPQNNVENNNTDIYVSQGSSCAPDDYFSEHIETKEELSKWFADKKYMQAKSEKFKTIYGDIAAGKRNLYLPYRNGKEIGIKYIPIVSGGYVQFICWLEDNSEKDGRVVVLFAFPSERMRGETDPIAVFKDFWPNASTANKIKKNVTVMGKDTELAYYTIDDINYNVFVYNDMYVTVRLNDKDYTIEEFLDGFELRPIELTTFSTAEKE